MLGWINLDKWSVSILLIVVLNPINNCIHLKNMVYDVAAFPVFSVPITMFVLII